MASKRFGGTEGHEGGTPICVAVLPKSGRFRVSTRVSIGIRGLVIVMGENEGWFGGERAPRGRVRGGSRL